MPARSRALPVVLILAGLLVVLTACSTRSGRGSSPPPTTPSPTTTDPGVTTTTTDAVAVRPAVEPVGTLIDGSLTTPDGLRRTWHLYVPASLPEGERVPLLVALHGGFGNGLQFRENSGFDGLAEANGFLVVFPDGTPIPAMPEGRVWNAGGCCGAAAEGRQDVDDVGFVSALIDQLVSDHPVDADRIFAAGHSNGAMMSYRLACELSDVVAGIGVQAGALFTAPCSPDHPVSVLHLHGSADANLPISGGRGDRSLAGVDFPDPHLGVEAFARLDGCPDEPEVATDPANPDVTTETWSPCRSSTTVRWVRVEGANHAWMGHAATSDLTERRIGTPYADLDASLTIWSFLASLPRR